jgi:hypothetical protein
MVNRLESVLFFEKVIDDYEPPLVDVLPLASSFSHRSPQFENCSSLMNIP